MYNLGMQPGGSLAGMASTDTVHSAQPPSDQCRIKLPHSKTMEATDLVHVAAEELVVTLQSLHKAPRSDDASLLLLRVDLQQSTSSIVCRQGGKVALRSSQRARHSARPSTPSPQQSDKAVVQHVLPARRAGTVTGETQQGPA